MPALVDIGVGGVLIAIALLILRVAVGYKGNQDKNGGGK